MISPRKGTESGHHMRITHISPSPYQYSNGLRALPMCQVCGRRDTLNNHPVGLRMCWTCEKQVNAMITKEDFTLMEIRQLSKQEKAKWVKRIDAMHLPPIKGHPKQLEKLKKKQHK